MRTDLRKSTTSTFRLWVVIAVCLMLQSWAIPAFGAGERLTMSTATTAPATSSPGVDIYLGTFQFTLNKSAATTDLTSITITHYGSAAGTTITAIKLFQDGNADPLDGGTTQYGSTVATLTGNTTTFADPAPSVISIGTTTTTYAHVYATVASGAIGSTVGFRITSATNVTWSQSWSDQTTYPVQLGTTTIQSANTPPTVSITSPANGSSFAFGSTVSFTGTATDTQDGNLTASLGWTSSLDGSIGSGGSFSTSALSIGTHTITASVTDGGGATGQASISVTITNNLPVVAITSPTNGSSFTAGTNVTFTGTATDVEDGSISASLSWSSSIDGAIGTGASFSTSTLSTGTHTITASVTDSNGGNGQATISITINPAGNTPPTVSITSPTNGASFTSGTNVTFTGTASDVEDGNLSSSLDWSSNLDGSLATNAASFSTSTLSVGTHTITASVTDSGSLTGQAQITITINPPGNTAPSVSITSPANLSNWSQGASITFTGTATDAEDGTLTASLSWVSSLDGAIGTGGTFSRSDLSVGTHTITASVTDSGSLTGQAQITITVTAPSVTNTTTGTVSAVISSCRQITVRAPFTGDDDLDGSIKVEYNTTNSWPGTTACASVGGVSPRQCLVTGLTPSTQYWTRTTFADPDGVSGTNPQVTGPHTLPACTGDQEAPTITMLTPARGAVIGGTDVIKFEVFDGDAINSAQVSVDGGAFSAASPSATYTCGANCTVYEFTLNTTGYANGSHGLIIRATDATSNIAETSWGVVVQNASGQPAGGGNLLRRTHGSQLCLDCHALPTHSSAQTSRKYGNWSVDCLTCHTPHKTRNIYLVREMLQTVNSGMKTIVFQQDDRTGGTLPNLSYLGDHTGTTYDDGICESCHTKTNHYRNDTSGGDHTHNQTTRCVDCHSHSKGFAGAGCNGCHNAPPTVGKHRTKHDEVWDSTSGNTASSYDDTTSHATPTQYGFACARCHSGTHTNDKTNNPTHDGTITNPWEVEVTFQGKNVQAPFNGTYSGTYNANQDLGPVGEYWSWSGGTCSNTYCHSNAEPRNGATTSASVTWTGGATTCASCHKTQARDDGGNDNTFLSRSHAKHIKSTSGETGTYAFKCDECHSATIVNDPNDPWNLVTADLGDKTMHVNEAKDVAFSSTFLTTAIDQSGASYNTSTLKCSNSYCHSSATSTSAPFPAPNNPDLVWGTSTSSCRSCHSGNATTTPTMSTNKHTNHVNNAALLGVNLQCAECHNATVSAGNDELLTNFTNHVNGVKNVSGTNAGTWNGTNCQSSGCHSSGQRSVTPQYYTATWATDSLDCKGCHGRYTPQAFVSVAGEPNYANGGAGATTANSHARHVSAATDCAKCHADTVSTSNKIDGATPAKHLDIDGVPDILIGAAWDNNGATSNYTAGTKTCNNIACHGAGTPQWGATLVCLNCHTGTEGGSLGDGTPNAVDDQWSTAGANGTGHGGTDGGSLSSTLGGCDYCHQLNAAHTPTAGTNPYRLRTGVQNGYDFGTADTNGVCLACHSAGDPGISQNSAGSALTLKDSSLDVDTAHFGTKHQSGEGGMFCWDCHDPHGVPNNILMVKSQVSKTSNTYGIPLTTVAVNFTNNTTAGQAVGRLTEATNTPRTGICQACHDPGKGTDPTNGSTKYWRSDGSDVAANPSTHNAGTLCTNCHAHTDNFKGAGGGPDCRGCHGVSGQGSRRPVDADFGRQSHHVGNGGSMGGTLSNFDCVVCHGEGEVINSATSDCPDVTVFPSPCTNPTFHANGTFDLRNVDSASATFEYNKDAVAASAGAAANWNSGNQLWREWTSGVNEGSGVPANAGLDRFCISCHDADGASQIANFRQNTTQTTTNPFADGTITNNYDLADRTRVVDIASRVDEDARTAVGGTVTPTDRDNGYAPAGVMVRGADGRNDPPEGVFSRHAIRGMSVSVYGNTNSNLDQAAYWTGSWNSTSVMGCADCHTVDGANTTTGNAHGSASEYLLKDINGGAAEGTLGNKTTGNYVCYRCHDVTYYDPAGSAFDHTGNSQDFQDYVTATGTARISASSTGGNVYGYACGTCHGGGPASKSGATFPTGSTGVGGFGTIHGTSQVLGIGSATGTARPTYRFTNGNSMRYYDPGDWTTAAARSCYTIGGGDTFGGCTKHASSAGSQNEDTPKLRPLNY